LQVIPAGSAQEALDLAKSRATDFAILDQSTYSGARPELLEQIWTTQAAAPVVLLQKEETTDLFGSNPRHAMVHVVSLSDLTSGDALRRTLEQVARRVDLQRETQHSTAHPAANLGFGTLVGNSTKMRPIFRLIAKTAKHLYPVLILGESGTGKELVARSIHEHGPRKDGPFVPVDCSALAPSLIESELFGHVKGAFTGAVASKPGLMTSASGGTLFLDEIGNLPMDLQVKLLRAIQEKEVKPVGSNQRLRTDARIIAATNRDLEVAIREETFRRDLYFRLNVVQIRIPPLRERQEDIEPLVHHFMQRFSDQSTRIQRMDDETMKRLKAYDWPGNVRELENAIERAMALSSGPVLHVGDLPSNLQHFVPSRGVSKDEVVSLEDLEREAIFQAIRQSGGDKLAAARRLGIGKTTLYRKLKEYRKRDDSSCR
jgi:two-component system response regulator HydG